MITICSLIETASEEDLVSLGIAIGEMAEFRPDKTHCILQGVREGISRTSIGWSCLGDVFEKLWRYMHFELQPNHLRFPHWIALSATGVPSGVGPTKNRCSK